MPELRVKVRHLAGGEMPIEPFPQLMRQVFSDIITISAVPEIFAPAWLVGLPPAPLTQICD
jgi:hypothetical protein